MNLDIYTISDIVEYIMTKTLYQKLCELPLGKFLDVSRITSTGSKTVVRSELGSRSSKARAQTINIVSDNVSAFECALKLLPSTVMDGSTYIMELAAFKINLELRKHRKNTTLSTTDTHIQGRFTTRKRWQCFCGADIRRIKISTRTNSDLTSELDRYYNVCCRTNRNITVCDV